MTLALSRRGFLTAATATAALATFRIVDVRAADMKVIDVVVDGDTNISDWWSNTLKPAFEAANPGLSINVVITRANGGNALVAERVVAALAAKADPKVDYFEEFDPRDVPGAIAAGAFEAIDETKVPNYALVNPLGKEIPQAMPYRASQVLLAYDGAKIVEADAPKTFEQLVTWIKANPGQFIYCRPDKGGSGKNFVVRAIHEANGRDPDLFKPDNFDAAKAKAAFAPAWSMLKDLQASLYDGGAYPAGNNPTLQLFAGGAVSMITAWSDMALQGIAQGVLPETTKLIQLSDLAFSGGFAVSAIPANAAHKDAAFKLADFLLSPAMQEAMIKDFGAFPAVSWDKLSPELFDKYKDVVPTSVPAFPGGDWSSALNDGWYTEVATNVARAG